MKVARDISISDGAKVLYLVLDDYAGLNGSAWPHQDTLAEMLAISIRCVQKRVEELARTGHIERTRTKQGNRYQMSWQDSDPHNYSGRPIEEPAQLFVSDPHNSSGAIKEEPVLKEPAGGVCPKCNNTGTRKYFHTARGGRKPEEREGFCGCPQTDQKCAEFLEKATAVLLEPLPRPARNAQNPTSNEGEKSVVLKKMAREANCG